MQRSRAPSAVVEDEVENRCSEHRRAAIQDEKFAKARIVAAFADQDAEGSRPRRGQRTANQSNATALNGSA
jgi:hypothetical protein